MTAIEKWNYICDLYKRYYSSPEKVIQNMWENIFSEVFGYSHLKNEIDIHRSLRIGSTDRVIPDIIIKNNENDLFVVELKQYNLPRTIGMDKQLYSYLKLLHNDLGVIICDRIVLVDFDYIKEDNQNEYEILFEENNPEGILFIEYFSKHSFNKVAIKELISNGKIKNSNIESIKKELSVELLNKLLLEYFSKKYSNEEICQAIGNYSISISDKRKVDNSYDDNILHNDMINTNQNADIIFMPSDERVFKQELLKNKKAKRTWIYKNGKEEVEYWDAQRMTSDSNLRGNICSTNKWRNRDKNGIIKVILEIIK